MGQDEIEARLSGALLPDRDREMGWLVAAFGRPVPQIAAAHAAFLELTPSQFDALRTHVGRSWERIRDIASQVPGPGELATLLHLAGGPTQVFGWG